MPQLKILHPGLRRSPGGGHGHPLQYSCLENPHGQRSLEGYSPWGHKESDIQGIVLTQESNQGLLHCSQILYLLSYQGRWLLIATSLSRWSLTEGVASCAHTGWTSHCQLPTLGNGPGQTPTLT